MRKEPLHIGDKFGHWTVIGECVKNKYQHDKYLCQCDCEKKTLRYVDEQNLKRGLSFSCGCEQRTKAKERMTTHGYTNTKLFWAWGHIKSRCYNPKDKSYKNYGGRGIRVCNEWLNSFESFKDWALSNGFSDELSIDRIDVNGNYEPDNCRWITMFEQAGNKRTNVNITYNGETHTVAEWQRITGNNHIGERYRKGYSLEDVFYDGKFSTQKRRTS